MSDDEMEVNLPALKFMARQTNAIIKLRQALNDAMPGGWEDCPLADEIDMIMVDDSRIEITTQRSKDAPPLETQAKSQISALRVLHAAKTVDVTEKLIVLINNSRGSASASATGTR